MEEHENVHELFIPGFTPPPVLKDWERDFYPPTLHQTHHYLHESAKLLKAQHFFIHEEDETE